MKLASDYAASVRSLVIHLVRDNLLQHQPRPLYIYIESNNRSGRLITPGRGLLFNDDAYLRVEEFFVLDGQGNVSCEQYTYHYERPGGYYFRFEREQHDNDKLYKPEYHLHVLWRLPHFPSAPIALVETLNFIRVNFYSPHGQRLVGQSLAVHI
jgi:hypothetical protein